MEEVKRIKGPIGALVVGAITVWSYTAADLPMFQRPELARIFFWHFPCPMIAVVMFGLGSYFAFRYLRADDLYWDVRSEACFELGYIFCLLTMISGILFSRAQWGAWWQNDIRQTSFLLVLLIYFAYFAIRASLSDPLRRAYNAGGYALASFVPAMFLVFIVPRLPQFQSMHPNESIMSGNIKGTYLYVTLLLVGVMSVLTFSLYQLRVRSADMLRKLEDSDGTMENSGGRSAPTGVVRPVSLSKQD